MGWFTKLFLLSVFGYVGYAAYDLHRGGFFDLPPLPPGAYPISFENGFRGIVYGMDVTDSQYSDAPRLFRRLTMANPDRRFLNLSYDVPPWFENSWSNCRPVTNEELADLERGFTEEIKRDLVGARFDAICFIEFIGEKPMLRGLIFSIPA